MTTTQIHVATTGRRLVATGKVSNVQTRYSGAALSDFDEAVADVAMMDGVTRVELIVDAPTGLASGLDELRGAREDIREALGRRSLAVAEAAPVLLDQGWSQRDAANLLGLSISAVRSMSEPSSEKVHGASLLGDEPVVLDGDSMTIGAWDVDGDRLIADGKVRVSGLARAVQDRWIEFHGWEHQPGEEPETSDAKTSDSEDDAEDAGTADAESTTSAESADAEAEAEAEDADGSVNDEVEVID